MSKKNTTVRTYKCIFPGCGNVGNQGFFKFPIDINERSAWLQECHLNSASLTDRVCQKHFEKSDLCIGLQRIKLKSKARPIWNYNSHEYFISDISDTNEVYVIESENAEPPKKRRRKNNEIEKFENLNQKNLVPNYDTVQSNEIVQNLGLIEHEIITTEKSFSEPENVQISPGILSVSVEPESVNPEKKSVCHDHNYYRTCINCYRYTLSNKLYCLDNAK